MLRDIESLGHEVSVLKNQMKSVRQDIEKVGSIHLPHLPLIDRAAFVVSVNLFSLSANFFCICI